jgi:tetratricopeptide (TPR) repeat protein
MGNRVWFGIFAAALAWAGPDGVEWNRQGAQLYDQARYREAETLFRRALTAFEAEGAGQRVNRAITLENLAVMLRAEGRYRESEQLHLEAVPALEGALGNGDVKTARAFSNLAALYWSWGKLEKAEPLALRAEKVFAELSPASPADQVSNAQILASIYLSQHRYEAAKALLNEIAGSGEAIHQPERYGNRHPGFRACGRVRAPGVRTRGAGVTCAPSRHRRRSQ